MGLIQSVNFSHLENGYFGLDSHFDVFDKSNNSDFSGYPKQDKINLWKTIFALKEFYFDKYQPAIVEHFIDLTYASFKKRLHLYQKFLNPDGYQYVNERKTNSFFLVKSSIIEKLDW